MSIHEFTKEIHIRLFDGVLQVIASTSSLVCAASSIANVANLVEKDGSGDDEAECVAWAPETRMMMVGVKINILGLIFKPFVCECGYPLGGGASHMPECGLHWVKVAQVLHIFLIGWYFLF
jgi:hypothetical protein